MDKMILIESLNAFKPKFICKLKKIYGNCHDTMIGYFVDWWLENDSSNNHFVIQNVPNLNDISEDFGSIFKFDIIKKELSISNETTIPPNKRKVACDALFCLDDKIVGLLEVEGTKPLYILNKIAEYFKRSKENPDKNDNNLQVDYSNLDFAIVLFYPTGLVGKAKNKMPKKATHNVNKDSLIEVLNKIQKTLHKNQKLVLMEITKKTIVTKSNIEHPIIVGLDPVYYALRNSSLKFEIMDQNTLLSPDFISTLCSYRENSN